MAGCKAISTHRHSSAGGSIREEEKVSAVANDTESSKDRGASERGGTRRRKSLSAKQLSILEVIQRSVSQRGYPPSMREIGDAVGLSSLSSVTHQLNQLELSGYLRRDPKRPRALEVLIDLPGSESPADSAPP